MSSFIRAIFIILTIPLFIVACGGGGGGGGGNTAKAPVANAGPDQTVLLSAGQVDLDGSQSSDLNGDNITYSWVLTTVPDGSTAILVGADTATPSFVPDMVGLYQVTLTASDGTLSDIDVVDIDVSNNAGPTANAGLDQDVNIGVTVTLNGAGSTDPENDTLIYTWTQIAGYGPDVTAGAGVLTGVTPSFTAPASPTTLLFDLRVNDGFGDSNADRVQINVFTDVTNTVFVSSLSGDNGNSGTSKGAALQGLQEAINLAQINGADVYLDVANPIDMGSATLILADGVSLYGGFDSTANWSKADNNPTIISTTGNIGVSADGVSAETVLDQIKIVVSGSTTPGESVYGLFAAGGSNGLSVTNSEILVGGTATGTAGNSPGGTATPGGDGGAGQPGCENSTFLCSACSQPIGGSGGTGVVGSGGNGGAPGHELANGSGGFPGSNGGASAGSGTPDGLGNWNPTSGYIGNNGVSGNAGNNGTAGAMNFALTGYDPGDASAGTSGTHGGNGGGGGGGGGGSAGCDSYGGAGGGGGGGGAGGINGDGGFSAGGGFAIYAVQSNITVTDSVLTTGNGGAGGVGGTGQSGGAGGAGGWGGDFSRSNAGNPYGGSSEQDDGSNGGKGGNGGNGGNGGHGGGGAGGHSIGILNAGGSISNTSGVTYNIGSGGPGGTSAGISGPSGLSLNSYDAP